LQGGWHRWPAEPGQEFAAHLFFYCIVIGSQGKLLWIFFGDETPEDTDYNYTRWRDHPPMMTEYALKYINLSPDPDRVLLS
jgi:hypothetical protein